MDYSSLFYVSMYSGSSQLKHPGVPSGFFRGAFAKYLKILNKLAGGLSLHFFVAQNHRFLLCIVTTFGAAWVSCQLPKKLCYHRLIRMTLGT